MSVVPIYLKLRKGSLFDNSSLCVCLSNRIAFAAGVEWWYKKYYVDLEKTCCVKALIKMD
jgi:hypothetical protein